MPSTRASWTEGQNTLKLLYVVGDAPPHDDYTDEPNSRAWARRAQEKGIRINAIRCGTDATTQVAFARMANIASGEFASIDQDRWRRDRCHAVRREARGAQQEARRNCDHMGRVAPRFVARSRPA